MFEYLKFENPEYRFFEDVKQEDDAIMACAFNTWCVLTGKNHMSSYMVFGSPCYYACAEPWKFIAVRYRILYSHDMDESLRYQELPLSQNISDAAAYYGGTDLSDIYEIINDGDVEFICKNKTTGEYTFYTMKPYEITMHLYWALGVKIPYMFA